MEPSVLYSLKEKENYFYNIGQKSIEHCLSDFSSQELSEEETSCLKSTSTNLHHIIHDSRIDRWALNPDKRPFEEYWWIRSKY